MKKQIVLFGLLLSGLSMAEYNNYLPDGRPFVSVEDHSFVPVRVQFFGSHNPEKYMRYYLKYSFGHPDTIGDAIERPIFKIRCGLETSKNKSVFMKRFGENGDTHLCSKNQEVVIETMKAVVAARRQYLIELGNRLLSHAPITIPEPQGFLFIAIEPMESAPGEIISEEQKLSFGFEAEILLKRGKAGTFEIAGRKVKVTRD